MLQTEQESRRSHPNFAQECGEAFESEALYPTLWRGNITLETLLTDQDVRNVAFAKMRSIGHVDEDAQDCFQLGSIKLWKALVEQPSLLIDKRAAWVGVWIAYRGSTRSLWKHKKKNVAFDKSKHHRDVGDERTELYPRNRTERWATFATRVDERLDFILLMNTLAQRYDHDPLKLFALYSLTTSVKMKDVTAIVRADKNQMIEARSIVKADIHAYLQPAIEMQMEESSWDQQIKEGKNLHCVTRVAEQVMDNQRLLLALYIVTTSAKRKDVTQLFGIGLTAFRKEVTQIKSMLAEEFRKASRK